MFLYVALVAALAFCAVMMMRAARLLSAALWLAIVSLCVSLMLYALGAPQVAALELSIGAGLVTVLIVLAMSIAGDDALRSTPIVPFWTAFGLSAAALLAFIAAVLPPTAVNITQPAAQDSAAPLSLGVVLWQQRVPDILLQAALMFVGLLAVLGLLADSRGATHDDNRLADSQDQHTPAAPSEAASIASHTVEAELELV